MIQNKLALNLRWEEEEPTTTQSLLFRYFEQNQIRKRDIPTLDSVELDETALNTLLQLAVLYGNIESFKLLAEKADVESIGTYFYLPCHVFIDNSDIPSLVHYQTFQHLIAHPKLPPDISQTTATHILRDVFKRYDYFHFVNRRFLFKPLHIAAVTSKIKITKLLIAQGANITSFERNTFITPLHLAARVGCWKIVKHLIRKGADIDTNCYTYCTDEPGGTMKHGDILETNVWFTNQDGVRPIHVGVMMGNLKVTEILIEYGASVDSPCHHSCYTPLHVAAEHGRENIVTLLLSKGADVNIKAKNGVTPLHLAARNSHLAVVDLLLKGGANVDELSMEGKTALHYLLHSGETEFFSYMKQRSLNLIRENEEDYMNGEEEEENFNVKEEKVGFRKAALRYKRVFKKIVESLCELYFPTLFEKIAEDVFKEHARVGYLKLVENFLKEGTIDDIFENRKSYNNIIGTNTNPQFRDSVEFDIAEILLKHGADPNIKDSYGKAPVFYAFAKKNFKITELLLRNKASREGLVNFLNSSILSESYNLIAIFLQYTSNINTSDQFGRTPLHCFAVKDQGVKYFNGKQKVELAELLIHMGADVNAQTVDGISPLHLASSNRHREMVSLFVAMGANTNIVDSNGMTALHCTMWCEGGDTSTIKDIMHVLLKGGININAQSKMGLTALHLAVSMGRKEVISALIEYGADLNLRGENGESPLHYIAENNFKDQERNLIVKAEMAKLLISRSVDINATTNNGKTTLHLAAENELVELVNVLIEYGAGVNCETDLKITPLHIAASNGNCEVVETLLKHGASFTSADLYGRTALHIAVSYDKPKVVEILLTNGASVRSKLNNDVALVHIAAMLGSAEVIQLLLKFGADINVQDKYGNTALHYIGTDESNHRALRLLLDHGADPNIESADGHLPFQLMFPKQGEHSDIHIPFYRDSEQLNGIIMRKHLIKYYCANIYINEKNKEMVNEEVFFGNFKSECKRDVERMKKKKIDKNRRISIYDVLRLNLHNVAILVKNEEILQKLEYFESSHTFKHYSNILRIRLRQAIDRKILYERATENIYHDFPNSFKSLPINCIENILKYLTNADLIILTSNK